MARVLVTAAVDYQQHVGEYGVHWNFFFTLVLAAQPVHGLLVHVHSATTLYCAGIVYFIVCLLVVYALCCCP